MPNYKQTSTKAMADADFSAQVEAERKRTMEEYEAYLSGKGPNPYKDDTKGSKQSRMTRGHTTINKREAGGSVCGKPTGQGFGKARMR